MNAFKLNDDAIKFFKNSGLDKSREVIKMSSHALVDCGDGSYFHINQLKQIVDAWELVESKGGLIECKKILSRDNFTWCSGGRVYSNPLERAINLVEQCNA